MTTALPVGNSVPLWPDFRVLLYVIGQWEQPVYDSDASDMHPVDFLLYGPHRELMAVYEAGRGWHRWTRRWVQVSRRRFVEHDDTEFLRRILVWSNPLIAAVSDL